MYATKVLKERRGTMGKIKIWENILKAVSALIAAVASAVKFINIICMAKKKKA